jgi:hypothetical protein
MGAEVVHDGAFVVIEAQSLAAKVALGGRQVP